MSRGRRDANPSLAVATILLLLGACAGGDQADKKRVAPITLSFPYGETGPFLFSDYDQVAARSSKSYVAIEILADPATVADAGSELVSAASGTVIGETGFIVTAAHIAVDPKYRARVKTVDGRVYRGQIVSVDRDRELALIKVPATANLVPARLADSSRLVRGEHAVAIGSPRGRDGSVSLGLIKQPRLNYLLEYNGYSLPNAVVISMEVEPGHSGGPVFNENGELIGMVASFALGDTRKVPYVSPRIAFAVPANDIESYASSLVAPE